MGPLHVVILAAGDGTRMRSRTPKVLHPVLGRPLAGHAVAAARSVGADTVVVVVSPRSSGLRELLPDDGIRFALQDPPRGTGDAAACGLAALDDTATGKVIVLNGDCPGIRPSTLRALLEADPEAEATFLSVTIEGDSGYGRFVRDASGDLLRIVEQRDADDATRSISEVNAGVYSFDLATLRASLSRLRPDNSVGELYLTDTLELIRAAGGRVAVYHHADTEELHGVNNRVELARAERLLATRKLEQLMLSGVTVRSPATVRVDVDVDVGADTVVYPGVVLESGTQVGTGCTLYPHVRIARSQLADSVTVLDGSVIEDSVIEAGATIGPYARLRPGSHVCEAAKVGNFVEMKATTLGKGSKASHLTYLGDADVGDKVNVGAGTITCNYDGVHKHRTVIEDGAFIGSNTALVAPVRVGAGAYVGAGSTITRDVPAAALGVARARQHNREDWAATHSPTARAAQKKSE